MSSLATGILSSSDSGIHRVRLPLPSQEGQAFPCFTPVPEQSGQGVLAKISIPSFAITPQPAA